MTDEELKFYIYNVLKTYCQNEYDRKKAKSKSNSCNEMLSFRVYGMTIGDFLDQKLLGYNFPVQRVITVLSRLVEERAVSYYADTDRYVCKDIRVL